MLQYFETICLQWKAFDFSKKMRDILLSGGTAGGLWRHEQWSPSWPSLVGFLQKNKIIRNLVKTAINGNFCV